MSDICVSETSEEKDDGHKTRVAYRDSFFFFFLPLIHSHFSFFFLEGFFLRLLCVFVSRNT